MDNNLKAFTISITDVELFKKCCGISTGLHENKILNLEISNGKIKSTTANAVDSCYKHWVLDIEKIGDVTSSDPLLTPIKCSIYNGGDFSSKILTQLNQKGVTGTITFYYDSLLNDVKQIEVIASSTEKKKKIFSFKFKTSDVSLIYTEFDEETIEMFFSTKTSATLLYEFKLLSDDLKRLRLLLNLDVKDDTQNNHIAIKFNQDANQISLTDEITDFVLSEDATLHQAIHDDLLTKDFNIDKKVFKEIDTSTYIVQLREIEGSIFMVLFNETEKVYYVTAIPLLEAIQSTISYQDVLNDQGKFG